jgi:hypothetical protein
MPPYGAQGRAATYPPFPPQPQYPQAPQVMTQPPQPPIQPWQNATLPASSEPLNPRAEKSFADGFKEYTVE